MAQHIAGHIHSLLVKRGKTLSVAESCTGGELCALLTRSSGSSRYFSLGIVAYSNIAKERILKVPTRIIARHGAVSAEVALRLALGVREICASDYGIGITGIAGPAGAVKGKPVGTVFIAACSKTKKILRRFRFRGSRSAIRHKTTLKALELLKSVI
jgi:nicotinamide-nucleotide amidase